MKNDAVLRTVNDWRARDIYPYLPEIATVEGVRTQISGGQELVSFSSCDYLGVSQRTETREEAIRAIRQWGTNTPGAQLFSGHTVVHSELERAIGRFHNGEALLFPSGLHANLGVLSTLVGASDTIVIDQHAHSSILLGAKLSGAAVRIYRHRDLGHLQAQCSNARGSLWIATDGVFSADGTVADLSGIRTIARANGARLLVDDAHGIGAWGAQGRGVAGLPGLGGSDSEILVGTMSKAVGSSGGYVVSGAHTIDVLRHTATSYQASRGLTPAAAAAALASFGYLGSSQAESERGKLRARSIQLRSGIVEIGVSAGESTTHVVPAVLGDSDLVVEVAARLRIDGYLVTAMVAPGVPLGSARLRLCVTSGHTVEQIDGLVAALSNALK